MASDVTAIPLLPCRALDDVLPFYEALGWKVTTRQDRPNPYASMRWRGTDVHVHGIAHFTVAHAGTCLLIVPEVEQLHEELCGAMRGVAKSAGLPRITRMKQ